MQINLLVARDDPGGKQRLLVLPYGSRCSVPKHLNHIVWRNLATAVVGDPLVPISEDRIKAELTANGFALVAPLVPGTKVPLLPALPVPEYDGRDRA